MTTRRRWHVLVILAALSIVAVACGGDDGTTSEDPDVEVETPDEDPEADPPDEDPEADPPDEDPEAEPPETPDVEPFDSYKGVTADTIRVGVVTADLDELRDLGLVDINNGDVPDIWDVLVEHYNTELGGVAGRQIELVYTEYNPVFNDSAEDACVKLTQDEEVFIVLGGIAGPAIDSVLCFVEQNETAMIGGTHTPAHFPLRKAPWVAIGTSAERRHRGTLALYQELGLLDGKVATYDDSSEAAITDDVVLPALADLGVDVVESFRSTIPQGDEVALAEQASVYAEVVKDEEIDTLVIIQSQLAFGIAHMRENGFEGTIVGIDTGTTVNTIGGFDERDPATYEGTYSPMGASVAEAWELPASQECYDIYRAARPEVEIVPRDQVPDGDPIWADGLGGPCQLLQLLKAAGDVAGGDLNYDTLQAGFDAIGEIDLPSINFASIGPDKYDASDTLRIGVFDSTEGESGALVPMTDLSAID